MLIGATTENPSFEVNAALLSRSKVFVLSPLSQAEIETILERALRDPERGLGGEPVETAEGALAAMARHAKAARVALNLLELGPPWRARRNRRCRRPDVDGAAGAPAVIHPGLGARRGSAHACVHKWGRST